MATLFVAVWPPSVLVEDGVGAQDEYRGADDEPHGGAFHEVVRQAVGDGVGDDDDEESGHDKPCRGGQNPVLLVLLVHFRFLSLNL